MTGTTRVRPEIALERLAELGVRQDPTAFAVDGTVPSMALAVSSPEAVAEALALCSAADLVVIPWGGGGQMGLGNLPERYDVALDVRGLSQIVQYEPADLTIAVQAGRTLADLERVLAANGQMLPIDAAEPERVTVGGLVATGLGCPRRFGHGSLRDLIIGITVALPDGTLAKGGGIVVKNVSGYDMMRLHFGALGSLGVIVQANFKLLPAPEAQRTLLLGFSAVAEAAEAALTLRGSQLAPTALVVLEPETMRRIGLEASGWVLAARCEGPEAAVIRQADRLRDTAGAFAREAQVLDAAETIAFWRALQGALDAGPQTDRLRVRIGELPTRLAGLAQRLTSDLGSALAGLVLDYGSGLAYVTVSGTVELLRSAWSTLAQLGYHATMLAGPPDSKMGTDVFGRHPDGVTVMRRLKETFDPQRVLNRGRFIAHL